MATALTSLHGRARHQNGMVLIIHWRQIAILMIRAIASQMILRHQEEGLVQGGTRAVR
jgi:hypothetical protein